MCRKEGGDLEGGREEGKRERGDNYSMCIILCSLADPGTGPVAASWISRPYTYIY